MKPNSLNRRSKHVVLTPEGQRTYAEARLLWREAQSRFEQRFRDVEAAYLRKMLLGVAGDTLWTQPAPVSQDRTP